MTADNHDWHAEAMQAGRECLESALDYLSRGWSVLGICPPDHAGVGKSHGASCASPGKRPWPDGGQWKRWQDERPDEATVRRWWAENPLLNVGLALGPVSGLVRVDIDGPAGETALVELSGGDLPPTLEFVSGREGGGRGLLYAIPPGAVLRTTAAHDGDGELRLQAKGAQTVLPPSRHASGGRYRWVDGRAPDEIEAAIAPAWLVKALSADAPKDANGRARPEDLADGEIIPAGRCDETLTSMAGTMRRRGFSQGAIEAALLVEIDSGRVEQQDGKRAYDATDAARIARSVGKYRPDEFAGVTIRIGAEPGKNGKRSTGEGLMADDLDGVEVQPVHWLVPGLIPLSKLVLLAGDGGMGKSTVTLSIAADGSRGLPALGRLYDPLPPFDTLIACCEDDYADTVVPRLLSHGADLKRIHAIKGIRLKDGAPGPFSLASYEALEEGMAARPDVRLVIIDPAGAFVGRTGVDDYKDSELRALLGPLSELAARRSVTILLVKHLVKGTTVKAVHKVGGSAGYVNAVRAAFVIVPDADDPDVKLFLPLKFNLAPRPQGLSYRLSAVPPSIQAAVLERAESLSAEDRQRLADQLFRVEWLGEVDTSADDAFAASARPSERGGKLADCQQFLEGLLLKHPIYFPSEMLDKATEQLGFSNRTVISARKFLRDNDTIRSKKINDHWYVGPKDKALLMVAEEELQTIVDSWVQEFLSEKQGSKAARQQTESRQQHGAPPPNKGQEGPRGDV